MSNRDFDEKDLMKDVDELYKVNSDSSADQHENMPGAESEAARASCKGVVSVC